MNINQLKEKLDKAGIKPNRYSFDKEYPNESMCLNNLNGKWEVYYSEKGQKSSLKSFDSESEACDYLYNLLIKEDSSN